MSRMMMLDIGYGHYAVEPEDAIVLLGIASRAKKLTGGGYRTPYVVDAEQEFFVTAAALVEVAESVPLATAEPSEKPDDHPF